MIIHTRVDERLIHGQVAAVWTNLLKADRIYVANDKAWQDDISLNALKLAKPSGKKLTVSSINRAIENFKNDRFADERVFLIAKNIQDMKRLVEGIALKKFNVGNLAKHGDSKPIKNSVALSTQDIKDIEEMLSQGVEITAQMVPGESDASIATFIKDK
jgi:PTS system mannose-specific IIB component